MYIVEVTVTITDVQLLLFSTAVLILIMLMLLRFSLISHNAIMTATYNARIYYYKL